MPNSSVVEVDGSERLEELAKGFEFREVQIELERCGHSDVDVLKTLFVPSLSFEAINVSLADECQHCALNFEMDMQAECAREAA